MGLPEVCSRNYICILVAYAFLTLALGFGSCKYSLAAQNFAMPAMSPTMTEGNIASWKVKEGEEFMSISTRFLAHLKLVLRRFLLNW